MNNNNGKIEIQEAFAKARIEGSRKLQMTTTTAEFNQEWEKYSFVMLGFESQLSGAGVRL